MPLFNLPCQARCMHAPQPDSATRARWEAEVHASTDLYNAGDCVGAGARLLAALRTAPALADALFSDEELLLVDDPAADQRASDSPNMTVAELMNVEITTPTLLYVARALRSSRCYAPEQGVRLLRAALALLPRHDAQIALLQRPLQLALAEARRGVCCWRQHEAEERWLIKELRRTGAAGWRQLTAVLTLSLPILLPHWLQISRATLLPAVAPPPRRVHGPVTPSRQPLRVAGDLSLVPTSRTRGASQPARPIEPRRRGGDMAVASADFRVHVLAHLQHGTYRLFSPRAVRLVVVTLLPADAAG